MGSIGESIFNDTDGFIANIYSNPLPAQFFRRYKSCA